MAPRVLSRDDVANIIRSFSSSALTNAHRLLQKVLAEATPPLPSQQSAAVAIVTDTLWSCRVSDLKAALREVVPNRDARGQRTIRDGGKDDLLRLLLAKLKVADEVARHSPSRGHRVHHVDLRDDDDELPDADTDTGSEEDSMDEVDQKVLLPRVRERVVMYESSSPVPSPPRTHHSRDDSPSPSPSSCGSWWWVSREDVSAYATVLVIVAVAVGMTVMAMPVSGGIPGQDSVHLAKTTVGWLLLGVAVWIVFKRVVPAVVRIGASVTRRFRRAAAAFMADDDTVLLRGRSPQAHMRSLSPTAVSRRRN